MHLCANLGLIPGFNALLHNNINNTNCTVSLLLNGNERFTPRNLKYFTSNRYYLSNIRKNVL